MPRRAEEVRTEVRAAGGRVVEVWVVRSGSVHWQYGESGNGWELVLAPALALLNVLSHHLLWRRGWLIRAYVADKRVWRQRFRSRDAAMAALPTVLDRFGGGGVSGSGS